MFRAQQEDYMVVSFYETRKKMVRRFGIWFGMVRMPFLIGTL